MTPAKPRRGLQTHPALVAADLAKLRKMVNAANDSVDDVIDHVAATHPHPTEALLALRVAMFTIDERARAAGHASPLEDVERLERGGILKRRRHERARARRTPRGGTRGGNA